MELGHRGADLHQGDCSPDSVLALCWGESQDDCPPMVEWDEGQYSVVFPSKDVMEGTDDSWKETERASTAKGQPSDLHHHRDARRVEVQRSRWLSKAI